MMASVRTAALMWQHRSKPILSASSIIRSGPDTVDPGWGKFVYDRAKMKTHNRAFPPHFTTELDAFELETISDGKTKLRHTE